MHSEHIYVNHNILVGNAVTFQSACSIPNTPSMEGNTIDGGNILYAPATIMATGCSFTGRIITVFQLNLAPKLVDETVTGNRITNTAGSGIYLHGMANSRIAHNIIRNSTLQMDDASLPASAIALNCTDNVQVLQYDSTRWEGGGRARYYEEYPGRRKSDSSTRPNGVSACESAKLTLPSEIILLTVPR